MPDNNQAVTKTDLDQPIAAAVQKLTEYIDERTRSVQTELLRAFADYTHSTGLRFSKLETDIININSSTTKRLGELERQLIDLRLRLIAVEGHRS